MKTGAHDSDDGERTFVEVDGAADEMGIGAEAAAPEFFADDRDGRGAGPAVLGNEGAAQERRHLQDVEEPGGNNGGVRDERFAAAGDGEIVLLISGQFGEHAVLRAHVLEIHIRNAGEIHSFLRLGLEHNDELIGRGVRQWLEQNSVDDAEDGGVRADAESEGENRNRGEAEILAHHAERVTRVGDESFEPEAAALLAAIFLDAFYRAELQRRLASRFIGRHAGSEVRGHLLFEVMAHLLAELPLPIAALEPSPPEIHGSLLRFNCWANSIIARAGVAHS